MDGSAHFPWYYRDCAGLLSLLIILFRFAVLLFFSPCACVLDTVMMLVAQMREHCPEREAEAIYEHYGLPKNFDNI